MPGNRNNPSMSKPPVKSRLGFQRPPTNPNHAPNNRPRKISDRLGYPRNTFPNQFVESDEVFNQYAEEGELDLDLQDDQNTDYAPFPLRVTDRLGGPLARKRTDRFRDDADNVLVANVGRQRDGRSVRFGDESHVGNGFPTPASTDLRHNIIAKRMHQQALPANGDLRNRLNHMRHDNPISPDAPDARERIMDALASVPVIPDHDFSSHGFRPLKITTATLDSQRHIQMNPESPVSDVGVHSKPTMKSTMASRLGPIQAPSSAHVPNEPYVKPRASAVLPGSSGEKRSPDVMRNGRVASHYRPVSPVREEHKRAPARKRMISPPSSEKGFSQERAGTPVEDRRRPEQRKRKISPPRSDRGSPQQRHIAERNDGRYAGQVNALRKDAGRRRERSASPPAKRRTTKSSPAPLDRSASPLPKRRITKTSSSPLRRSASPPPKYRTMKPSAAPVDRFASQKHRAAMTVNRRQDIRRPASPVSDNKPSAPQRRPVVKSKQDDSRTRPHVSANVRNAQPSTNRGQDEVVHRGNAVRRDKPDVIIRKVKEDVIRKEKHRPNSPPRRKEPSRAVKPVVYDRVSSSSAVSSEGSNRRRHRDDRSLSDVSRDDLDDSDNMSDQSSERQGSKRQDYLSDEEDNRGRRYSRGEPEYDEVNSESEGMEDSRMDVDDSRVDETFETISPDEEHDWANEEDYQRQEPKKYRQHRPAPPEEESDEEIDHYEVTAPDHRDRRNVNAGGKRAEKAEHVRLSVSENVSRHGADVDHNVTNTFISGDTVQSGLAGLGGRAMGMALPAFPPMPFGLPQFSSYRMSMNMSMPLMSLPHSLSAGGPTQYLQLPSPRMLGATPMISLTPHDIHQHLAMFQQHQSQVQQQHQQNQVQQQHQQNQAQQQHQLPVQQRKPVVNQVQAPTGARIKPPISQRIEIEPTKEKQTEAKPEEVEQRPQSSQQQKSTTVTNPVRLQQIRLKPPQSNLKRVTLTATSPNAEAAGRASPIEPASASSSTNGRDNTNLAKVSAASPSKASDVPSRTITFRKNERRAAANKTVSLEMDASFASGSAAPNWSLIPVCMDRNAYSHRGHIDLGVFDWELLENDPRLSTYCQRAGVPMPTRPAIVANVGSTVSTPAEAAVASSSTQNNQSVNTPRDVSVESAMPGVKVEADYSGNTGSDLPSENVRIKQETIVMEDIKVKVEIQDDASVGVAVIVSSSDAEPGVKEEPVVKEEPPDV